MSDAPAYFKKTGYIGYIVFNRPHNRNSLTPEMLEALAVAIDQVKADTQLRCLIVTGTGTSFCAGGDFSPGKSDSGIPFSRASLIQTYSTCMDILHITVPVIGALNGHAIGGGFGVCLLSDIRVANKDALYGANFARLGMHSGMSISYMLPRLIGLPRASELMFTGRRITGTEAERIGLVNYAVAADQVLPKALELADEIAACAPTAVQLMKRSMRVNMAWDPHARLASDAEHQANTFNSADGQEGIAALLEKREPVFNGQ